MESYPDIVKREYGEGHLLGNYTNFGKVSKEQSNQNIDDNQAFIRSVTGHETQFAHVLYNTDEVVRLESNEIGTLRAIGDKGYTFMAS